MKDITKISLLMCVTKMKLHNTKMPTKIRFSTNMNANFKRMLYTTWTKECCQLLNQFHLHLMHVTASFNLIKPHLAASHNISTNLKYYSI